MIDSATPSPYAVPLEALERRTRVPVDELTEELSDGTDRESAWAWDEDRRQARLAGGA